LIIKRKRNSTEVDNQLLRETGGKCGICGCIIPLVRAHIVPWSESHDSTYANQIILCRPCEDKVTAGQISQQYLRELKAELAACPPAYKYPMAQAFSFELGSNPLLRGDVLLGVDDHRVIWRDPDGIATGLCAEFRDREDRVVVCIQDGVLENLYPVSCKLPTQLGDKAHRYSMTAAIEPALGGEKRVHLAFVVDHYVLRLEAAQFWVRDHKVSLDLPLSESVIIGSHDKPALWLYTPDYRGDRTKAMLSIQLSQKPGSAAFKGCVFH